MNKNTKIRLNYIVGGAISLFLLCSIYGQVTKQLASIGADTWKHTGPDWYLLLCISLMFVNTSLEGSKWYLLTNSVEPVKYFTAFSSYLAGVAFSIVTPNRIGEYPGRILYLGRSNTWRYINVSVLGVVSQLSGVYIFGLAGLIYYNITFPALLPKIALGFCLLANSLIIIIYWRFEKWLPLFDRIKWLGRFFYVRIIFLGIGCNTRNRADRAWCPGFSEYLFIPANFGNAAKYSRDYSCYRWDMVPKPDHTFHFGQHFDH